MDFIHIDLSQINPRVLKAYITRTGKSTKSPMSLRKDQSMIMRSSSSPIAMAGCILDKTYHPVSRGISLSEVQGQTTKALLPYTCYAVILDLMDNTGKDSETYDFNKAQEYQQSYSCPSLDRIPPVVKASHEQYSVLFDAILKEHINPGSDSATLLKGYCLQLLCRISREAMRPDGYQGDGSAYRTLIRNVIEYVEQNISNRIMLKDLAAVAGMSPNYFHRVFTRVMGMTPNEFVISKKMNRARELLATTSESIADISLECGFENIAYFSYVFKRYSGITPSSFRVAYSYPLRQT